MTSIIIMCIVIGYYIISKTEKYDYSDIEKISNIIEEDQEVDDNIIENVETTYGYCTNCGAKLTGNYCSVCGTKKD